jgi:hypothetical protein
MGVRGERARKHKAGTGYWARNCHELLLIGTRGSVPIPAPGDQPLSVFDALVREHSRKPEVAYEIIEKMFPNVPKIELNAREHREGWDSWGFEAPAAEPAVDPEALASVVEQLPGVASDLDAAERDTAPSVEPESAPACKDDMIA